MKLIERRRVQSSEVWRIVLANHRTPRNTWGDFHAMIGALNIGERRLAGAGDALRPGRVSRARDELMDYSERRLRAEIAELPDGRVHGEMMVEDDGVAADPFEVKVNVVIGGDEVIADFTGSSPQVRGPMNCTFVVVASAVYNAVFCITDPQLDPAQLRLLPAGAVHRAGRSVVNVRHPGPSVGGNTDLQPKLIDLLLAAFAQAVPDASRQPAAGRAATSCSAACIRRPAATTATTTSTAWATGGTRARTATTARSRATRTAATRRSRCSSTAIRC